MLQCFDFVFSIAEYILISAMVIAHRTLIVRKLKGLEDIIGVTSVHPHLDLSTGTMKVKTKKENC